MPKFMILEGLPGVLVPDPDAGPMRFVGQKRKSFKADAKLPKKRADRYEPTVAAKVWEVTWHKAVKKGMLKHHKTVVADNATEALASVRATPAKAPKAPVKAPKGVE
jgi:hypothetical protein